MPEHSAGMLIMRVGLEGGRTDAITRSDMAGAVSIDRHGVRRRADAKTGQAPGAAGGAIMTFDWQGAWAAVIHHPLFGIGITLGAYQLVLAAFEKTRWMFLQPVLVSMLLVIGVLLGCGLSYAEYRKSTEIMSILLGPAGCS